MSGYVQCVRQAAGPTRTDTAATYEMTAVHVGRHRQTMAEADRWQAFTRARFVLNSNSNNPHPALSSSQFPDDDVSLQNIHPHPQMRSRLCMCKLMSVIWRNIISNGNTSIFPFVHSRVRVSV